MNKEQQIKEMADEIFNAGVGLDGVDFAYKSDHFDRLAIKLYNAGYRKQSETITFYKDPNIKDWAESEYAWCERPCDSNMSMRAIDKKGIIVGYASEHYWTWCDVKEVKKVSAIEYIRHFASKQSDTVKEFAEKVKMENKLSAEKHRADVVEEALKALIAEMYENGIRPICNQEMLYETRLERAEERLKERV